MKKAKLTALLPVCCTAKESGNENSKYIVQAKVEQTGDDPVLRATVFTRLTGNPFLTVFCSQDSFVSWNHDTEKWSDATLEKFSVIGYEYMQEDSRYHRQRVKKYSYDTATSMQAGAAFFDGADDTLSFIIGFQRRVRDAATMKRHENQRRSIDTLMAQARPLPKHFQEWVDRVPLVESRYLYYRRKGQRVQGYCTVCGADVVMPAAGVKHNQMGVCPHCHKKITFKAEGISKNVFDEARAEYVQRISDGRLMVREIDITKRYGEDYRNPQYSSYEGSRHIVFPDGHKEKYIHNYNISWLGEWKLMNKEWEYYATLYTPGLAVVLKGTAWQYCAIERYAKQQPQFAVAFYLADSIKHPCVEYFSKVGFFRLLDERQNIVAYYSRCVNWDGHSPREVLKIRKNLIPLAAKNNVSSEELEKLQFLTEANLQVDDPNLEWLDENCLRRQKSKIISLLRHMTLWKIRKYSEQQSTIKDASISDIVNDWADYLRNAELLEYNFHKDAVLFPKDLKKAHDSAMKLVNIKHDKIVDKKLRVICKELSGKFGFSEGDYIICAPSCLKDLLVEGDKLNHCVATNYAEPMALGETTILFIRRADSPEKPFVTMEVRNGHVIQVRGFDDNTPEKPVLSFVENWKKKVLEHPRRRSA